MKIRVVPWGQDAIEVDVAERTPLARVLELAGLNPGELARNGHYIQIGGERVGVTDFDRPVEPGERVFVVPQPIGG